MEDKMKKYFLLAIILLCTMNSQAQIVNERNKERIKQTIKEGFEDVKEAIKQNNSLPDEHEQWDTYVVPKVGLNVSNMPGRDVYHKEFSHGRGGGIHPARNKWSLWWFG